MSVPEFSQRMKLMELNPPISASEIENMTEVLQFEKPGFITYQDVVDHIRIPDK